jgi:uncharacterized protein
MKKAGVTEAKNNLSGLIDGLKSGSPVLIVDRGTPRGAPRTSGGLRGRPGRVRFWDASAIVPLLVSEASTPRLHALAASDPHILVWWASEVECASALARRERGATLDPQVAALAFTRLKQLAAGWHEVDPSDILRETAVQLLRVHPLRAADALQLAAAFVASEQRPASLEITLDDRLASPAQKEGFAVINLGMD